MRLCSPAAKLRTDKNIETVPRPASLAGLRIGFLDNTKSPVDKMLAHLEQRLHERYPEMKSFHASKVTMGLPASAETLASLRANADVVINALGD